MKTILRLGIIILINIVPVQTSYSNIQTATVYVISKTPAERKTKIQRKTKRLKKKEFKQKQQRLKKTNNRSKKTGIIFLSIGLVFLVLALLFLILSLSLSIGSWTGLGLLLVSPVVMILGLVFVIIGGVKMKKAKKMKNKGREQLQLCSVEMMQEHGRIQSYINKLEKKQQTWKKMKAVGIVEKYNVLIATEKKKLLGLERIEKKLTNIPTGKRVLANALMFEIEKLDWDLEVYANRSDSRANKIRATKGKKREKLQNELEKLLNS